MSYPGYIDTVLLTIQVSDGATSPTYTHPCLINLARGLNHTANATATEVPACNAATPGKTVRTVTSTDFTADGNGILDAAASKTYADWLASGVAKDCKIQAGSSAGHVIYTGPLLLLEFNLSGGKHGDLVQASIKLAQSDAMTISAHA